MASSHDLIQDSIYILKKKQRESFHFSQTDSLYLYAVRTFQIANKSDCVAVVLKGEVKRILNFFLGGAGSVR